MKKLVLFTGLCILFLGLSTFCTMAQETTPPTDFIVFEEFVSPADKPAFRKAQNEVFKVWDKYNPAISMYSYSNDDNSYFWVIPIENFASLDVIFEKMMGFAQKIIKEEGFDPYQKFRDLSTTRHSVIHWSQELSYHPSGEYGQSLEKKYIEWSFYYMKPGHENEAKVAINNYIEFYDSIEESYEWDLYVVTLGHDTPCWIIMKRAENAIALRKQENKLSEKYNEKFGELSRDFYSHVRKVENKKGWFLPKWSKNVME